MTVRIATILATTLDTAGTLPQNCHGMTEYIIASMAIVT